MPVPIQEGESEKNRGSIFLQWPECAKASVYNSTNRAENSEAGYYDEKHAAAARRQRKQNL